MNAGNQLKRARLNKGLSPKAAAQKLNISDTYIRQLEKGINNPPTWTLLRDLADLYGCSIDDLLQDDTRPIMKIDDLQEELIEAVLKLPKHRQQDLLEIATLFAGRKEKDDALAFSIILERVRKIRNVETRTSLLDLLGRLDSDSGE